MKVNNCPACRSAAAIRSCPDRQGHCFRVWVQCELCGMRTRDFVDMQEPKDGSAGTKFAVMAWNSGDYRQEATAWDK